MKSVCVFPLPSGFHHSNILNMTSFLNRFPPACLPDIRPSLFWSGLSNSYIRLSHSYQWSLDTGIPVSVCVFLCSSGIPHSAHQCLPMAVSTVIMCFIMDPRPFIAIRTKFVTAGMKTLVCWYHCTSCRKPVRISAMQEHNVGQLMVLVVSVN